MIHIFYRHYNVSNQENGNPNKPGLRGRPNWFSYEKCFINLLNTIKDKNVKLHVVFDGAAKDNFIWKYKDKYILHEITAGTDQSSFYQTWKIAKNSDIGDNDLIYFLENDYLHVNNWVEIVEEWFLTHKLPNYISLYDHNDKYHLSMYENLTSKIFTTKNHHWRTTPSTCGSFIVNKDLFNQDFDIHTTVDGDHNKFIQCIVRIYH